MSIAVSAPEAQTTLVVRLDDGVPVVELPCGPTLDELREQIRTDVPSLLPAIGGRASRIDIGERDLDLRELRRLLSLLKESFGVEITGVYARPRAIQRFAERELKLKLFPVEVPALEAVEVEEIDDEAGVETEIDTDDVEIEVLEDEVDGVPLEADSLEDVEGLVEVDVPDDLHEDESAGDEIAEAEIAVPGEAADLEATDVPLPPPGRRTRFVHRTIRSGTAVKFDGDVVILGDVNPGAQIIASGNVLVLGILKGVAHAGATGDEEAYVFALELRPPQLRVARKIAIPPERPATAGLSPELARIVDDRIVIEPYRTRNSQR